MRRERAGRLNFGSKINFFLQNWQFWGVCSFDGMAHGLTLARPWVRPSSRQGTLHRKTGAAWLDPQSHKNLGALCCKFLWAENFESFDFFFCQVKLFWELGAACMGGVRRNLFPAQVFQLPDQGMLKQKGTLRPTEGGGQLRQPGWSKHRPARKIEGQNGPKLAFLSGFWGFPLPNVAEICQPSWI